MEKISTRQIIFLYTVGVSAFSAFALPGAVSSYAGRGALFVPLISAVVGIVYFKLVSYMISKGGTLKGFINMVFPKRAGSILGALTAVWIALVSGGVIRAFYERLNSTAFLIVPRLSCVLCLSAACFLALIAGKQTLARCGETAFIILALILTVIAVLDVQAMEIKYMLPFNFSGEKSLIGAFVFPLGMYGLLTIFLYFFEVDNLKNGSVAAAAVLPQAVIFIISAVCLFTFGPKLSADISYPFFSVIKSTDAVSKTDNFSALFSGAWILMSFVLVSSLYFSAQNGIRGLFKTVGTKKDIIIKLALYAVSVTVSVIDVPEPAELNDIISFYVPLICLIFGIILTLLPLACFKIRLGYMNNNAAN